MAITGSFSNGTLSVFGDSLDNTAALSRNAAGAILVNGGAVAVTGGTPTVANTALIQAFGQAGNDTVTMDEANGALPRANLFGGTGNDLLTGGSGNDQIFGQADSDLLQGKGGADFLFGGDGDDVLIGGAGNDQMLGEAGNDRMIWNTGDGSDLLEGGADIDTAEVNGGSDAEVFTVTANGGRVRFDRVDPTSFSLDIGTTESLVTTMNGGDDRFTGGNGLAALIALTVDGGTGKDTITGGDGADVLRGGDGNDSILGGRGNDTAFLGSGADVFAWNPGDGSDVVEGGTGQDRLQFNGSNIAEVMQVSDTGGRVLFTRDIAAITMDLNEVETLEIIALGGADRITLGDLSGTDLRRVEVKLAGTVGGSTGDGAADSVTATGSTGADRVSFLAVGTGVSVLGLPVEVVVSGAEAANDTLVVNLAGGKDRLDAGTLPAGAMRLVVDAGADNDTVLGSSGHDLLSGGDGKDVITGSQGNDTALLGAGDDRFIWNPGDGNDVVEGQEGTDSLLVSGSNLAESVAMTANGGRVLVQRDVDAVSLDLDGVERIDYRALGGADSVTIGDLAGTGTQKVVLDLSGSLGGGDGAADSVTVNATAGADLFGVSGDAGGIKVFGLAAQVQLLATEQALDRLTLHGQAGDDVIDASELQADALQLLTLFGGFGADRLIGSAGNDLINGGDGNDLALMGAGDDSFVWNPGDDNDIVEGQAGFDTLLFNGANIAETIAIGANGGRALFTRDIAAVTMDLNDVERIAFTAFGGADRIRIGDLSGTEVTALAIDLGGADAAADTVTVAGTAGADTITVATESPGVVTVTGLGATIRITGFDAADRLVIDAGAGNDRVDASGLLFGAILLTANGGDGDDSLIGGGGADILNGEAGNDTLIGGAGVDALDGGIGDNILIQ